MLSEQQIKDSVSIAAKEYPIKCLFGSYASGKYHQNSDVDLLAAFHTDRVSLLTLNSVKYRLEELWGVDRRIPLYGA